MADPASLQTAMSCTCLVCVLKTLKTDLSLCETDPVTDMVLCVCACVSHCDTHEKPFISATLLK